jgi:hypothetical protein
MRWMENQTEEAEAARDSGQANPPHFSTHFDAIECRERPRKILSRRFATSLGVPT